MPARGHASATSTCLHSIVSRLLSLDHGGLGVSRLCSSGDLTVSLHSRLTAESRNRRRQPPPWSSGPLPALTHPTPGILMSLGALARTG